MERLRDITQETVHLAVRERDNVVIIERLESPQPVRTHVTLGMAVPMVASANGKAILSTLPDSEIQELLERGLTSFTDATVTDPAVLWAQVEEIRTRGYATNEGEWRGDVVAVAAPIMEGQRAGAGLSISTPAHRMTPQLQEEYGNMLLEAAASVSDTLPTAGSDQHLADRRPGPRRSPSE
jgi:IclR family acetate operon transcriptional repressor